jgi:hypothetical protein
MSKKPQQINIRKVATAFGMQFPSLSDAIWEMIEPYLESDKDPKVIERFAALAVAAWNMTLFESDDRQEILRKVFKTAPEELHTEIKKLLESFMKHKELFYSQDQRHISDYQVVRKADSYHLRIYSQF